MNELFHTALAFVLRSEGGYANHPDDTGGMTYKGITQSTYNKYRQGKQLPKTAIATEYKVGTVPKGLKFINYKVYKRINKVRTLIKNVDVVIHITDTEVEDIYYNKFWLRTGCDKMSKQFSVLSFDTAVNMGVEIVKATGMTRAQEFLKAAEYKYPDKFIEAREEKYRVFANTPDRDKETKELKRDKKGDLIYSQKQFLKGWLNRMAALKAFIKTL